MHCPRCKSEVFIDSSYDPECMILCRSPECRWHVWLIGSLLEDDINIMIKAAPQEECLDGERLRQA